jgi:hypothetical protein
MDPSEAIKIGPVLYSREQKSASIEPPEQISSAAHRTVAIRQISEKK